MSVNLPALEAALAELPADHQMALRPVVLAADFRGSIPQARVEAIASALGHPLDQTMLDLLDLARAYAVAPISRFQVGAVARGLSGNLYFGANMEFANQALACCVHAEQAAVANAWVHGETGLATLAVSAAPCGSCRQFLNEIVTAATLRIVVPRQSPLALRDVLPQAFGPGDLGQRGGLLSGAAHQLTTAAPAQDPVVSAALRAARMSYAPYSQGYAGVALETVDRQVVWAPYAENAAFNPSLSPMGAALSQLRLAGSAFDAIRRAVLVQAQATLCSQVDISQAVLTSVANVELQVVEAHPE
ncbi:MAG TPA: cytidine deaminase [Chloroflexota bacterium]|nr:cytidine deaminase [Chloroflexota bacterium]